MRLQKQTIENKTFIKISGENRMEILQEFWKYINYGKSIYIQTGTEIEDDSGLTWLNENQSEAYFVANTEQFIKTLINIQLFKLTDNLEENQITDEIKSKAKKLGLAVWNKMGEMKERISHEKDIDWIENNA